MIKDRNLIYGLTGMTASRCTKNYSIPSSKRAIHLRDKNTLIKRA